VTRAHGDTATWRRSDTVVQRHSDTHLTQLCMAVRSDVLQRLHHDGDLCTQRRRRRHDRARAIVQLADRARVAAAVTGTGVSSAAVAVTRLRQASKAVQEGVAAVVALVVGEQHQQRQRVVADRPVQRLLMQHLHAATTHQSVCCLLNHAKTDTDSDKSMQRARPRPRSRE
jgi:hypothetical protein